MATRTDCLVTEAQRSDADEVLPSRLPVPVPGTVPARFRVPGEAIPAGRYHNCAKPCGTDGCVGWPGQLVEDQRAVVGYGTPVPAPTDRPPFAADPEPRPDATRQQGR